MGQSPSQPIHFPTPADFPGAPYSIPPFDTRTNRDNCIIRAPDHGADAGPIIQAALNGPCRQNAVVRLPDPLYNIDTFMETTRLQNVEIHFDGRIKWSDNDTYWLANSRKIGYQGQSTAWLFGGDQVWLEGGESGTLDGNGQMWYDKHGGNNVEGRPHAITFYGLNNSIVEKVRFWQSQMWSTSIIFSNNLLLQDINVNNTNLNPEAIRQGQPCLTDPPTCNQNTDGADTIFSNNITFSRWVVDNHDDSISAKANSTNIMVDSSTFYNGLGIALGSIGQYPHQWVQIKNMVARNLVFHKTQNAAYIKTWTGNDSAEAGTPPNGGGGGTGQVTGLHFHDWTLDDAKTVFAITQCTTYLPWNAGKWCDSSELKISDLDWSNIHGTTRSGVVTDFHCSGAAPCTDLKITDVDITNTGTGKPVTTYNCDKDVVPADAPGNFKCTLVS